MFLKFDVWLTGSGTSVLFSTTKTVNVGRTLVIWVTVFSYSADCGNIERDGTIQSLSVIEMVFYKPID